MDKEYLDDLARVVTKAGRLLLENGAEVYRVEDSMTHLCKSYGCSTVDSYATPTLIIVSFTLNKELSHNVKRVSTKAINLDKVDKVNDLIRKASIEPIDLAALDKKLDVIENEKANPDLMTVLCAMLVGSGFALAFHGTLLEIIFSALIAAAARLVMVLLDKTLLHSFFKNLAGAFVITFLALALGKTSSCDPALMISSAIMLLVPGIVITNAVRDSINGDLNSSLIRFLEVVFIAVAIGLGSGLAYYLLGGLR